MSEKKSIPFGKAIVLNGTSSAGKSTLGKKLQLTLDEYWWRFEADMITYMQPTWQPPGPMWKPTREQRPHDSWRDEAQLDGWLAGFYGVCGLLPKTGANVIIEGGWLEYDWLLMLVDNLEGVEAYSVCLDCPLEEIERRETARGDRTPGYGRTLQERVNRYRYYDLEMDTSVVSLNEQVNAVEAMLASPPETFAFDRVRAERTNGT